MAEITASMVKELREKTDAPMMECKKALTEAGGDMGKAEEILRVKLGNKATKAAARVAAEGVVGDPASRPTASSARWSKSTAKPTSSPRTTTFSASPATLAELVAKQNPADVAALSALPLGRRHGRRHAHGAGGQDRREHVDPSLCARLRRQGRLASVHPRRLEDRRAGRCGGRRRAAGARTSRCTSPPASRVALATRGVPAELIETERRIADREGARKRASRRTSWRRWSKARCRST